MGKLKFVQLSISIRAACKYELTFALEKQTTKYCT